MIGKIMNELPTKEDYKKFIDKLAKGFSKEFPCDCFYLYGSFLREDFCSGISDVDGGFVFSNNVVLPREKIEGLSRLLSSSGINKIGVENVQFNLLDSKTSIDGRFLSYGNSYVPYLKQCIKIPAGINLVEGFNSVGYKNEILSALSMSLRKVRNFVLMQDFIEERARVKGAKSCVKSLWDAPKRLLEISGKEFNYERRSATERFCGLFPNYDADYLKEVLKFRKLPLAYQLACESASMGKEVSFNCLNAFERMIKCYLEKFPSVSKFEAKK